MEFQPLTDPVFYAVAVPALLLVGISKGGFGGGFGLIGVPLLALAVPIVQAAAVMLPILCFMDLFALASYRGKFSRENVRVLLPASLFGIGAGAWAFGAFEEGWIRGLVGSLALGFAGQYAIRRLLGATDATPRPRAGTLVGVLCGGLSGFASMIAHAGGPPMSVYLLPQRLEPGIYVGTTVILFTVFNYVKLIPYTLLGELHAGNLATSLVLAPLAPLGIWLGRWLQTRVSEDLFYEIAYALLLVVGARLVWEAIV